MKSEYGLKAKPLISVGLERLVYSNKHDPTFVLNNINRKTFDRKGTTTCNSFHVTEAFAL